MKPARNLVPSGFFYFAGMRVDKFLWCIRVYKTRSIATDQIKKDRVTINDEEVKPSREVKLGDKIAYKKEGVELKIEVLDIPKSRMGAKLVPNFIKDITDIKEIEKQEFIKMMRNFNRPKGMGRPSKKDRRDLDNFMDND